VAPARSFGIEIQADGVDGVHPPHEQTPEFVGVVPVGAIDRVLNQLIKVT